MLIIPAIDLRAGKCVRLRHGDPTQQTAYDGDPIERARSFAAAGAQRLHVVDLDGAFGEGENQAAIASICKAVDIPVQTSGGIRSQADAQARFDAGAAYVILGTILVENSITAQEIANVFGDRIIAGIDARGEDVAIRGWLKKSDIRRDDLIRTVAGWGISRIIFTEISRDGTGEGYDLEALRSVATIAKPLGIKITASGGAKTIADIQTLQPLEPTVDSCIVGRAIYEGTIDLRTALATVSSRTERLPDA